MGRAVGRTVATVSSANLANLFSQMEVSLPPPQAAAAAITDSKEKDSASTWHRGLFLGQITQRLSYYFNIFSFGPLQMA